MKKKLKDFTWTLRGSNILCLYQVAYMCMGTEGCTHHSLSLGVHYTFVPFFMAAPKCHSVHAVGHSKRIITSGNTVCFL